MNCLLQSSRQLLAITAWMMAITVSFPTVIHAATNDTIVSCPDGCAASGTGSFCGTDGECHFFSCRDYLAYGREENTGISSTTSDATSPPELVCSSYSPTTTNDVYNGMIYGCMGYANSIPDPNLAVSMLFNEKCSAQINERVTFDCWQFAEGTNFDFFLSEAGNAKLCTEDDHSPPTFKYGTTYGYQNLTYHSTHSSTYSVITLNIGVHSTVDFNEDFATKTTMYSLLTIEEATSDTPTPAPTPLVDEFIPPYSPTIASSSASSARHNWMASSSLLLSMMKISYSFLFN